MNMAKVLADPISYGFKECPHCNGYGSSLKEEADRCTKCNGLGLVKINVLSCACHSTTDLSHGLGEDRHYFCNSCRSHYYKGREWTKEEWEKEYEED